MSESGRLKPRLWPPGTTTQPWRREPSWDGGNEYEEQAQLVSVAYSDPGSIAFKDGHMPPSTDQITTSACGMEGFVTPSGGAVLSSVRRTWQSSLLGDDRHSECPRTGMAGLLTRMRFGPCWGLPTFCGIVTIPYMSISTSSLLSWLSGKCNRITADWSGNRRGAAAG